MPGCCNIGRWLVWSLMVLLVGLLSWAWPNEARPPTILSGASAAQKNQAAAKDYKDLLPRIPPCTPAEALKTFQTLPGFTIEQVAAEPLVADPIAVSFDENGRLYVVEMCDYSEQDKDFLGQIRLLEDTDGDGRFDKSTIFADKLSWPTAAICFDGGVFIGAPPHIYYCKDSDGDGRADIRKLIYTGFSRQNVQGMLNTFWWGLDNRIHVATSSNGGQISRADDAKSKTLNLGGRNLAFDPRTLEMGLLSGASQHGMSYNDWGRRFVCSNSDHIQLVMYEDHYLARNPYLAAPSPRVSIAVEGPQADVFRISPVEPWRELRTKLRVQGIVKGAVEGGGRAAGYFTGSTGITIYRGDAWPAEYRGQAFVGDVGSNIVHRKHLEPDGIGFRARRVDDKKEFVASKDIWFRPCQFANAPDGTLYITDMYREVIEHPASLPPEIKKHLDLTSGRDKGRIYRVVPEGFKQRPLPRLGKATTAQLVATLEHRNGWHRDTAARLLFERQDLSARQALESLVKAGQLPEGRMHALYALQGLKLLSKEIVLQGLADPHPRVREHAIALSETVAPTAPAVQARLYELAGDPDLQVRYQAAFSLGVLPAAPARNAALARIARQDAADRWVRVALLSSVSEGAADLLADLAADKQYRASTSGQEFIAQLTLLIGTQARASDVAIALRHLEGLPASEKTLAAAMLRRLTEGLAKSGSPLRQQLLGGSAKAQKLVAELVDGARSIANDPKRSEKQRAEAVRTLRLASFGDVRNVLETLLASTQPQQLQLAAVDTLGKFSDAQAGAILIAAWPGLSPRLRTIAAESLFSRSEWLSGFLEAIEQKKVAVTDLDPARLTLLQSHANPKIRAQATRLVGLLKLGRRQDVLDAYKNVLTMKGDTARGKLVFQKVCAACHRLEGAGQEIGPNLVAMQNRGPETILLNVLDPNREVNPQFVNYLIETKDGRSFTGMIAAETATSITLKRAENQTDTILRLNIEQLRSTGLSIMPEGMEQQIDRQAMADLIAYLLAVK